MQLLIAMTLGCIGGGIYAISKQSLPIHPRRKVVDTPARILGLVLILLPFVNAGFFLGGRWIAATYFPASREADHWTVFIPLVVYPLTIAVSLTFAKRWSVPKHYQGRWLDFVPYETRRKGPDLSFLNPPAQNDEPPR